MREIKNLAGCPECGSHEAVLDEETYEIICKKCGLVLKG